MAFTTSQIKASFQCIVRWLSHDSFKEDQLLTVDRMPSFLKEPYIHTGYRQQHKPWKYYFHSILHLHNESMNVWTHLFGFVVLLMRLVDALKDFNVLQDKVAWPILGFGISCLLNMLLSSTAHLLHSKSQWHHYVLFLIDYAGVTLFAFGTGIGSLYICSSKRFHDHVQDWFLWANVFLTWFAFFACCVAKIKLSHDHSKRKLLMVCGVAFPGVLTTSPVFARYYECHMTPDCSFLSLNHISLVIILVILCGVTFAAHAPERWMPGCCDTFGHSHQIFHLVAVVTMLSQFSAIKIDIEHYKISQHLDPNLSNIGLSLIAVVVAETLTLIYFVQSSVLTTASKQKYVK